MTSDEADEHVRWLDQKLAEIAERFDSVQIFTTILHDDGEATRTFARGSGNWCARYGQVAQWIEYQKGVAREEGRKWEAEQ